MTYVQIFLSRNVDPAETQCQMMMMLLNYNDFTWICNVKEKRRFAHTRENCCREWGSLIWMHGGKVKGGQIGETWEAFTITALWAASTWRLPRRWKLSSSDLFPPSCLRDISESSMEREMCWKMPTSKLEPQCYRKIAKGSARNLWPCCMYRTFKCAIVHVIFYDIGITNLMMTRGALW